MTESSIDANVLMRLMLADVPQQTALAHGLVMAADRLYVSFAVFIEMAHALRVHYGLERPQISQLLGGLDRIPSLRYDRSLLATVLTTYVNKPSLSFVDIYLAHSAEANQRLPLWTFDRKLARQMNAAKELT